MTVSANDRRSGPYVLTAGQTGPLSFNFLLENADWLRVTRERGGAETVLVRTTDYTVSGVGEMAGGTIELTAEALADDIVTIEGVGSDIRPADFSAETLSHTSMNYEGDGNKRALQEIRRDAERSVRVPASDTGGVVIPPAAARANRFAAWGPEGEPIVSDTFENMADASAVALVRGGVRDDRDTLKKVSDDLDAAQTALTEETASRIASDIAFNNQVLGLADDVTDLTALVASGVKAPLAAVRVLATANVTIASALENGDTLDGVTLATGDRVALTGQSTGSQNGVYVVAASGAASRATDADSGAELALSSFYVEEGTHGGELWFVRTTPITIDSTSVTIARLRAAQGYEAEVIAARDDFVALADRLGGASMVGRRGALTTGTGLGSRTYALAEAVEEASLLKRMRLVSPIAGTIQLKLFSRSGDDFSQYSPDIPVAVTAGPNDISFAAPFHIPADTYIGFYAPGLIAVNGGVAGGTAYFEHTSNGNVTSFTDAGATTGNTLNIVFELSRCSSQAIGRPYTAATGTVLGNRVYVFATPAAADNEIQAVRGFGLNPGTGYLQVWVKSGDDFTLAASYPFPVSVGAFQYRLPAPVPIAAGQHVGLAAPSLISVNAATTGDSGGYYDSGGGAGGDATDTAFTDAGANTTVLLNFGVILYRNSMDDRLAALEAADGGDGGGDGEETAALPTEFTLYLAIGQSNTDGRGEVSGQAPPVGAAWMWNVAEDELQPLSDPTGNTGSSAGSMFPAFAREHLARSGRGVVIVNMAVGGTSLITNWGSGGSQRAAAFAALADCMAALDAAGFAWQFGGTILGIGETDGDSIDAASITIGAVNTAFGDLLTATQTATGAGAKMPMLVIQTGMRLDGDTAGYQAIRAAQAQWARDYDHVYLVSSVAKTFRARGLMPDTYHYVQAANDENGRIAGAAAAMICAGRT